MAEVTFPFLFESNFELGTNGDWDSQDAAIIDFPHYTELARHDMTPYKGAYCFRQVMTSSASNDFLVEGDLDIDAAEQGQTQFWLYFSEDFTGTSNDTVHLFELRAGGTKEVVFGFRIVASTNVINLGIGEEAPTSWSSLALERGRWHLIELDTVNDLGANNGTIDLYVTPDGAPYTTETIHAAQVGTLDQGAITTGTLGVRSSLTTTTGTILIDEFKFHAVSGTAAVTRVRQELDRWNPTIRMTQSGHAFVGPGTIENVSLVGNGSAPLTLRLWDTDVARIGGFGTPKVEMHTTGTSELVDPAGMPIRLSRGCYIELAGSADPSALVQVSALSGWGSEANVRRYGLART